MANGYDSSLSSSSGSSGSSESVTNTQGQTAPPGFHYMPDGSLMSDAQHNKLDLTAPEVELTGYGGGTPGGEFAAGVNKQVTIHNCAIPPNATYNPPHLTSNLYSGQMAVCLPPNHNVQIGDILEVDPDNLNGHTGGSGFFRGHHISHNSDCTPSSYVVNPLPHSMFTATAAPGQSWLSIYSGSCPSCCTVYYAQGQPYTNAGIGHVTPFFNWASQQPSGFCPTLCDPLPVSVGPHGGLLETPEDDYTSTLPVGPHGGLLEPIITGFILDFNDVPQAGEVKEFSIVGDSGSEFYLEIKNEDSSYYNFTCNEFQTGYSRLDGVIENNIYTHGVTFPRVTDNDQYEFYLHTKPGTKHVEQAGLSLFEDGSVDYNNSRGSNSGLLRKVLYQILDVSGTITTITPTGTVTINSTTTDSITVSRGRTSGKTFSMTAAVTSNAISVDRQPTEDDLLGVVDVVVGSAPIEVQGENIYPAVTGTDTVNGAVTSGTSVTMDAAVATKMKVGDRINTTEYLAGTSAPTHALDTQVVTVASLDSTNVFSLSTAVAVGDGLGLSFSNQKNYVWPVDNVNNLVEGMVVVTSGQVVTGTTLSKYQDITTIDACTPNEREIINKELPAVDTSQIPTIVNGLVTTRAGNISFNQQQPKALGGTTIKIGGYGEESIYELTGWDIEVKNIQLKLDPVTTTTTADTTANPSTTIAVASALGIADATTQTVDLSAGGEMALKYGSTGHKAVMDSVAGLRVGQVVRNFSSGTLTGAPTITKVNENTKTITLSDPQTFADGATITFSNSDISGIGIDSSVVDPYVTNISSLNLTSSVAQGIESGQTLTFKGAGSSATITGEIIVKKAGTANLSLNFDVEKFLTYHS